MAWMRQKPEDEQNAPASTSANHPEPARRPSAQPTASTTARETPVSTGKTVNIGPSVHIKGTLSGQEDLTVDGRVEGKITLKEHVLTIGANGQIDAELRAKAVIVHGKVVGDVTADNKVEIANSGTVMGDIRAPRVSISDGAMFKGSIDMDVGGVKKQDRREDVNATQEVRHQTAKAAS
jgi:cytoskeletal protein CcmA (bactofilin family)